MKKIIFTLLLIIAYQHCFCWGFFGHRKINSYATFLLPPQMMVFYKPNLQFISEHSVDPDMRRYAVAEEGARHYIDIDHYGTYPYNNLPRNWNEAVAKFTEDTLMQYGIVPWWIQTMQRRLTDAFREKSSAKILKFSAEIGHYIADAHVPLHATKNHNGQFTNQKGIHGFWESRVPELLADKEWDFFIGKAAYIKNIGAFTWEKVLESAAAADTVLRYERELTSRFSPDQKFAFENRNGVLVRQYSSAFTIAYDKLLKGMIERRMRQSVYAVACFWYTAWVDAGQPDLSKLTSANFTEADLKEFEALNNAWRNNSIKSREHDAPTP
ncbi:MAG: zinc dependent phospholipase C family protein [Chitinophagaceae bacterium]